MTTRLIYEPKGRAREYAELACNLFTGCPHGCSYCMVPRARHMHREDFHSQCEPRAGLIPQLQKESAALARRGEKRRILLCFSCDPYPRMRGQPAVTGLALATLASFGLKASVLTKGGMISAHDFPIMKKFGIHFGQTFTFFKDCDSARFEPGAAFPGERVAAARVAHNMSIATWASFEPVVDMVQSLTLMEHLRNEGTIDYWKVGRLNYDPADKTDYARFLHEARALLAGCKVYWKKDLLKAAGEAT